MVPLTSRLGCIKRPTFCKKFEDLDTCLLKHYIASKNNIDVKNI
jgi:hypothetical protein